MICMNMGKLYEIRFIFNEKGNSLPEVVKTCMGEEYMRLREFACEALNCKYEEWNNEFGELKISEDDELADFGGTEYCNYIRDKSRKVLKKVNDENPSIFIELDVDEIGDIIALYKIDKTIDMHMIIRPL